MDDMTVNVQEVATDRHLVLYDNFYLVQHLLHKKAKFIYPVNCRSRIYKQNCNSQQAAFRHFQGAWNHITTLYLGLFTWREGASANPPTWKG